MIFSETVPPGICEIGSESKQNTGQAHVRIQREGGGQGVRPPPLENDKNIGFLSNTGPDP